MTHTQKIRIKQLWEAPQKYSKGSILRQVNMEAKRLGIHTLSRDEVFGYILHDLCGMDRGQVAARGVAYPPNNQNLADRL